MSGTIGLLKRATLRIFGVVALMSALASAPIPLARANEKTFPEALAKLPNFKLSTLVRSGIAHPIDAQRTMDRRPFKMRDAEIGALHELFAAQELGDSTGFDTLVLGRLPLIGSPRGIDAILFSAEGNPLLNVSFKSVSLDAVETGQFGKQIRERLKDAARSIARAYRKDWVEVGENSAKAEDIRKRMLAFLGMDPAAPRPAIIHVDARARGRKNLSIEPVASTFPNDWKLNISEAGATYSDMTLSRLFGSAFSSPLIQGAIVVYDGGRLTLRRSGRTVILEDAATGQKTVHLPDPFLGDESSSPACASFAS